MSNQRKQNLIIIMKLKTYDYMRKVANINRKRSIDYVESQVKKWKTKTVEELEIINKGL